MNAKKKNLDVIVVGSGATGCWAAKNLVDQGLNVVLLEAGDIVNTELPLEKIVSAPSEHPYGHPNSKPFEWVRVRGIGGRMNVWTKTSLRMSNLDFQLAFKKKSQEPWPICYEEIEKNYSKVERALRVTGNRDHLVQVPDGVFSKYHGIPFHSIFKKRIESRWAQRKVILSRQATRNVHLVLVKAMNTGRLNVYSNSIVSRLIVSPDGRQVTGVVMIDGLSSREHEISGRSVVLCASTIETARLLLNSKSKRFPHGLANSSGVLGHYLMEHTTVDYHGIIPFNGKNRGQINQYMMSYIPSFKNVTKRESKFEGGYGIQCEWYPCAANTDGPCGLGGREGGTRHAGHFFFRSCGEVLPYFNNQVILNNYKKDRNGIPTVTIDFSYKKNEKALIADQERTLSELAHEMGFEGLGHPLAPIPGKSCHEVGTARMGFDPTNSLLNPFCQSWDVPNLYLMDGSCFVSTGFQNPTLTMMALCDRASQHLGTELRRGHI